MTSSQVAKPPPPPRTVRRTRWWAYAALLLAAVALVPIYYRNSYYSRLNNGLSALEAGNVSAAVRTLSELDALWPNQAEVAYWLAVAYRRDGQPQKCRDYLQKSSTLGYPREPLERQIVLARLQMGELDDQLEMQAEGLIAKSTHLQGRDLAMFLDEFYEARTKGYLVNYRVLDAKLALDHWAEARPKAIAPRFMRADIYRQEHQRLRAEREYQAILELDPNHLQARMLYARFLLLNQKVDAALLEFQACASQVPQEAWVQLGLATCEYRSGKNAAAARTRVEELLARDLPKAERNQALLLLAEIARTQKRHAEVIDRITEAFELSPMQDATAYQLIGTACAALGRREEAARYLQLAKEKTERTELMARLADKIAHVPDDASLRYQEGNLFLQDGLPDGAALWWMTAVRCDPRHQPAQEALAKYFADKGEPERAAHHRALAEAAVDATFDKAWSELMDSRLEGVRASLPYVARYESHKPQADLLALGLKVVERKELEQTAQELSALLVHSSLRTKVLVLMGEALYLSGNLQDAQLALGEALQESPRDIVAHRLLESINFDLGAYDRMEFHALQVADLDKADHKPHRLLGFMKKESQRWQDAIGDYEESLRRNPHQPTREEVLLELAECQLRALKHEDALATLGKATPSAAEAHLRAECYLATRRPAEAKQVLDAAIARLGEEKKGQFPLPEAARQTRAALLVSRADLALLEKEPETARGLLARAVKEDPQDPTAHEKLATVLARLGEREQAEAEAKLGKELLALISEYAETNLQASSRPDDATLRWKLADLATKLGRAEEAARWKKMAEMMSRKSPAGPKSKPAAQLLVPEVLQPSAPGGNADDKSAQR